MIVLFILLYLFVAGVIIIQAEIKRWRNRHG